MLRLVDTDFSSARKGEAGKLSPTLFTHIGDWDAFRFEFLQGRLQVVAHQEKFVLVVRFGIVERGLQRGHGKDQPSLAGIDTGKAEDVAEERTVSFGVLGIDDNVCPVDQA